MSLRYNNVQTCRVFENQGHCFILPITFVTSSRLDVSSEPLLVQRPPVRALEQQREVTRNNNKVEKTLYICKKEKNLLELPLFHSKYNWMPLFRHKDLNFISQINLSNNLTCNDTSILYPLSSTDTS
jgi:hypothetical protein